MANKSQKLHSCNKKIYNDGVQVAEVFRVRGESVDKWLQTVAMVARVARTSLDWYSPGSRSAILYLGDDESRKRVIRAINAVKNWLQCGRIIINGPPLWRGIYV